MALISETHAALRFYGDDLDPEELSASLGGQPSSSARKGDVVKSKKTGRERIEKTGRWTLSVERREPGDLNGQIGEILSPLTNDLLVWQRLGKYQPDLFVGFFLQESNEGIEVSAECLAMLAERGISLGLDVYGASPVHRNIQIIDGADNATFSVFQATSTEFAQIFPAGQDMEIADDFVRRVGEAQAKLTFEAIWERPILKRDANGIPGTLYFNYESKRQHLPTSKREVDLDELSINPAQRKLFAEWR
jgi:hypothetical protein